MLSSNIDFIRFSEVTVHDDVCFNHRCTDDIIILLNFIFTGLHRYQITKAPPFLVKDGDTCCTNPFLSNAKFCQYVKGVKNKIHAGFRRNLEEILEVKTFLKMSIGFKYQRSYSRATNLLILGCVHLSTNSTNKEK